MRNRILVVSALLFAAIAVAAFAQQGGQNTPRPAAQPAQAARAAQPPPLFFRETWKDRPAGSPTGDIPLTPSFVANPDLELHMYGHASEIVPSVEKNPAVSPDTGQLTYLWSGIVQGNWAVTLSDKTNYADLTGMGKIRWRTRQRGFHELRPVIKLADGTMLAGDYTEPTSTWWRESEFYLADVPRWRVLDPEQVVEARDGKWKYDVDLSKVDEIGFTDMSRGAGHGLGGSSAVDWIEVYAQPVKRTPSNP